MAKRPYVALALALAVIVGLSGRPGAARVQVSDDLVVHEWGTFTTIAGENGVAMPWLPLGGSTDLPCFVESFQNNREVKVVTSGYSIEYGRSSANTATRTLPAATPTPVVPAAAVVAPKVLDYQTAKTGLKGTVRMETPVLYFYASRPTDVAVNVQFTKGLFTEWYPTANVAQSMPTTDFFETTPSAQARMQWARVSVLPGTAPKLPTEPAPSHYYAARDVDASPVRVGTQDEQFLFYRGVGGFGIPISARLEANGSVTVTNLSSSPVPGVILFTRQAGKLGYRLAGTIDTSVTIDAPVLDGTLPELRAEIEHLLIAQGLYPREAQAMLKTWDDSWFEEGTRVLYIAPRAEVDRILPVQMDPAPRQFARAFVGRTEVITPAVVDDVAKALDGNTRAALLKYGRFLGVISDRVLAKMPASADKTRIESVLDYMFKSYLSQLGNCD